MKLKKTIIWLLLLLSISLSGCIYKLGGAEEYKATSNSLEGQELINEYDVKYISPDVYSLYFMELYKKDGYFAMNVRKVGGKILYSKLSDKQIANLQLEPDFNFWQRYSKWLVPTIVGLLILIGSFETFVKR